MKIYWNVIQIVHTVHKWDVFSLLLSIVISINWRRWRKKTRKHNLGDKNCHNLHWSVRFWKSLFDLKLFMFTAYCCFFVFLLIPHEHEPFVWNVSSINAAFYFSFWWRKNLEKLICRSVFTRKKNQNILSEKLSLQHIIIVFS